MQVARAFLAALMLGASAVAAACPICLGAGQHTVAQYLSAAQQAVLAAPTGDAGRFRVIEVLHGDRPSSPTVAGGYPRKASAVATAPRKNEALLLVREDPFPDWIALGAIGIDQAPWLRKLAVGKHSEEIGAQEWRDRVALVVPRLESPQPLVARIAYGELSAAPYAAMRSAKPLLDARKVRVWLADPNLTARSRLYLLLIGIAGTVEHDAVVIEQRLEVAWQSGDAANLASLLTADLELRGARRVAWIEEKYLRDRARSAQEIEAALLALSVQGNAHGVIPRERVIQAYRGYMKAHPDNAGAVAADLADWGYWDAVPEYQALMNSSVRQRPASLLAIKAYLQKSSVAKVSGSSAEASRAP
ncbi:MAG: hypothetical protein JNK92_02460 [Dechloromonas sp.]|nr:hypothetical protein [Dechloromonas sp.]